MLSGGCAVGRWSKVADTDVVVWGDRRRDHYDNNGAPYRHVDDVTRPTSGHVTSPVSTNSEAAFHGTSIVNLIFTYCVTNSFHR